MGDVLGFKNLKKGVGALQVLAGNQNLRIA